MGLNLIFFSPLGSRDCNSEVFFFSCFLFFFFNFFFSFETNLLLISSNTGSTASLPIQLTMTQNHKQIFIEDALSSSALRFGSFTLKSGRISPYFFNLGLFNTGAHLSHLATAYAETIFANREKLGSFDVLFGPAYKGISLAALTAAKLSELATARGLPDAEKWNKIEYAYNRKEKKDHGEGGVIVGSALAGKKVLIIDDVITAGTAIKEAFSIIENEKATVAGVLLALDRQETTVDNTKQSAVQIISKTFNVPVISIVDILDIIKFLDGKLSAEEIEKVKEYRQKYAPENL